MLPSKIALSLIASVCIATSSSAMEFQVLGAKAASMGGAGIATSPSSLAVYNNPALLAKNGEGFSIHLGGGVGIKDTGAGQAAGDLSDIGFTQLMEEIDTHANDSSIATDENIQKLQKARDIVVNMNGGGFAITPTVDFSLSYGAFGIGAFMSTDAGAIARVDQTHTALIFAGDDGKWYDLDSVNVYNTNAEYQASSIQYAVENGDTQLDVVGLALVEVPIAYGHPFDTPYGSLSVGGALKLMKGKTFAKTVDIDSDNAFDNLDENVVDSSAVGIDAGFVFKPDFSSDLTLALVGKNLNSPAFDVIGGGEYEIKPAFRIGAAYKAKDWIELALDADMTKNKSITEYNTQYIGGGANFDLSFLELNVGLMKNIASNDEAGLIYTAGVATGPDWLHFELSAQMASKTGEVEGTAYPKQLLVNFALSSAW